MNSSGSDKPHRDIEFAEKFRCPVNKNKKSAMTIYGWMKGLRTVPMVKLAEILKISTFSWKDVERNLISIKAGIRKGEIKPNFSILNDYKMGSIVGHVLGDGSIDKRFHSLFYSNSDIELLKEFDGYMKKIFGIEGRKWVQKKKKFSEKTEWLMRVNCLMEVPEKHSVGLFYPKICSDILYVMAGKFAEEKIKK